MLIQYTIVTDHKTIFHTLFQKEKQKKMIDYFKGLLMSHHLDIFMSGKNVGLNGLRLTEITCFCETSMQHNFFLNSSPDVWIDPVSELYRQFVWPQGLVFALICIRGDPE